MDKTVHGEAGSLHGETCIVTGGGRGIGRAIVEKFLACGAVVYSIDLIHPEAAAGEDRLVCMDCDITDLEAVGEIASMITSVDVLVNNAAAVTRAVPITELSPEEWQRTMAVNVTGTFNVSRSFLPLMRKGSRIINLASTFAHVGSPGRVAYSTTKGAILAFTRSLALEVAPLGIRVNSVSPGGIATDRLIELFGSEAAAEDYLLPLHPIGRTGKPADIADAAWFLASPHSTFMTGADLLVDGGYTAQ